MPGGFQIGRLFGTNIYVTTSFFLLLVLCFAAYGLADGSVWCLAVVLSLLVHEFGHVFAVKWFLKGESAVVLWGLGGLCIHEPAHEPGKRLAISLMGPAFEAVLGGVAVAGWFMLPEHAPVTVRGFVWAMLFINTVWVVANLLPILPLDGGQALRAALEMRLAPGPALGIARRISLVTAAGAGGAALYFEYPFAALLCIMLLMQNLTATARPL